MAIVKMRDLLRSPATVFASLEEDGEPILITRHGEPVAMLISVSQTDAISAIMATLPEFVERRASADRAIAEGRTISSEDLLARLAKEPNNDAVGMAGSASGPQKEEAGC